MDSVLKLAVPRFAYWRVSHLTGLYLITAVCGLVDAACFLSLGGVFAEIMTGNLLFMCFSIGTDRAIEGLGKYVLVVVAFAIGAVLGGRSVRGSWEERRFGFAVEWALLGVAAVATIVLHPGEAGPARYVVVSLLAIAMGMQNALIRRHGVPDLATNVMTLTVTAVIAESGLAGGTNDRWQRRTTSIGTFLGTAIIGAALTTKIGPWAPLLLAFLLFTLALSGLDTRRRP